MLLSHTQLKELKKPDLLKYALSITDISAKVDKIVSCKLAEFTKNLAERFEANEREFNEKLGLLKAETSSIRQAGWRTPRC